jgi:multiple sugar transport system ATP-binding protein
MAPILEINNLYKSYGSVEILKDINVAIEAGDFLVLNPPC